MWLPGYGFVQYLDHRAAEMALQSLNGRVLLGQVRVRRSRSEEAKPTSLTSVQVYVCLHMPGNAPLWSDMAEGSCDIH